MKATVPQKISSLPCTLTPGSCTQFFGPFLVEDTFRYRRTLWVMGMKEGICCDEHWVLYVSVESLNSIPETIKKKKKRKEDRKEKKKEELFG